MTSDFRRAASDADDAIGVEDMHGALRELTPWMRRLGTLDAEDQARAMGLLGRALAIGYGDRLDAVARAAQASPSDPAALLELGDGLVEQELVELAEGVLRRAAALGPDEARPLHELVAALERQGRYEAALHALRAASPGVAAHPLTRYLIAFHAAASDDLQPARELAPALEAHSDERYAYMGRRLKGLLARADAAEGLATSSDQRRELSLSATALIGGEIDSVGAVGALLTYVPAALSGLGIAAPAILALADRDSQVVGHALAALLEVPLRTWYTGADPGLVVAWELDGALSEQLDELRQRAPGQAVFAVVADPDSESPVAADVLGALSSRRSPPWGGPGATLDFSFSLDDDEDDQPADAREPDEIGRELAQHAASSAPTAAERDLVTQLAEAARAGGAAEQPRHRRWRRVGG